MGQWTKIAIPCTFAGFGPLFVMSMDDAKRYRIAGHGAIGRDGETLQPLGADSRVFRLVFIFTGLNFEGHKAFKQMLNLAAAKPVPAVLSHPVSGILQVYPIGEPRTSIQAKDGPTAIVTVSFKRHFTTPEVITAGSFVPVFYDTVETVPNLAGYLATLALLTVFQNQWVAALLTLMRLAGELPSMIDRSLAAVAEAAQAWVEGFFDDPFSIDDPPHVAVDSRNAQADALSADLRAYMGIEEAVFAGIVDGTGDYSAGTFANGIAPADGSASPKAATAATLSLCALWETIGAAKNADHLINYALEAKAAQTSEPAELDAAIVATRRRLQRAIRLCAATMPYHSGPACSGLSQVAASLTGLAEAFKLQRPPTRKIELSVSGKPIAVIALDYLSDATRSDEIKALNPAILDDFNRLPVGTVLTIPAA